MQKYAHRNIDGVSNRNKKTPVKVGRKNTAKQPAKPLKKKLLTAKPVLHQPRTYTHVQNTRKRSPKKRILFKHTQTAVIAGSIFLTFLISIATSQGIAAYEQRTSQNNIAAVNPAPENQASSAQQTKNTNPLAVTNTPITPNLSAQVLNNPNEIYLAQENEVLPDPLQKRKEFLEQYLKSKGSVLADHVDAISEQSQWKLIIAIARAESSFCKRHAVNNCWGIGGAWNLKSYDNYDQAINDVNRILEQHYIQAGLNSPGKIVNKWVGHPSPEWEQAVQEELDNLKNVQ